jgi:hypothetical protein
MSASAIRAHARQRPVKAANRQQNAGETDENRLPRAIDASGESRSDTAVVVVPAIGVDEVCFSECRTRQNHPY